MERSSFAIDVPDSLLRRAQQGEARAFEQLYRLFERPVYNLALRLLGDPEQARDALHDAMLKLFQRLDQFRGDAPFWGWLRQIALNEALMRLRKCRHYEDDTAIDTVHSESPAPWVHADASALQRALQRLPGLTRSVLWLFHVEGYTHTEIAEATGMTISFSKSQVARGTARLREFLAPHTEGGSCLIGAIQTN